MDYRNDPLIGAIASEYVSVFEVDVEMRRISTFKLYDKTNESMNSIMSADDYDTVQQAFVMYCVDPEYREEFTSLTELDYISNRLEKLPNYSCVYKSENDMYVELKVVRADGKTEGKPERIILGFADRNLETRERLEAQADKERYVRIMNAFAEEYNSTFYVDLDEDTIMATSMAEISERKLGKIQNKPMPYSMAYESSIRKLVIPSHQEMMIQRGSAENIRRELAHQKSFTAVYESTFEDVTRFNEMRVVKLNGIDEPVREVVIGFNERDIEIGQQYIVKELAEDYDTIAVCNLSEDRLHFYRTDYEGAEALQQVRYSKTVADYAEKLEPEYRQMAIAASDPDKMRRMLQETGNHEFIYKIAGTEKPWRRCAARVALRNSHGQPETVVLSFTALGDFQAEKMELTEKLTKALEESNAANAAKTNFLSNMSHDIRTPMNAIIGFTDMALKMKDDSEAVHEYLEKISIASEQLMDIINDVLDMSRIESGKTELSEENFSIKAAADNFASLFAQSAAKKNIDFSVNCEDIEHETVLCDRKTIDRILMNIVSNSLKFTGEGGRVSVRIAETAEESEGARLFRFLVEDNGIGMSPEFQAKIFEPFERERTSTVSQQQGTGLGMAIVKKLVDRLGGSIEIESRQGEGSRFTVTLPIKPGVKQDQAIPQDKPEGCGGFAGRRILLVDDIAVNREITRMMLSEEEIQIDEAENGEEAVEKFMADPDAYDAILMDIQMPVMDGYQAAEAIRKIGSKKSTEIPIIAMTANAFAEDRNRALDAGMNDHIIKPIDIPAFYRTLNRYL